MRTGALAPGAGGTLGSAPAPRRGSAPHVSGYKVPAAAERPTERVRTPPAPNRSGAASLSSPHWPASGGGAGLRLARGQRRGSGSGLQLAGGRRRARRRHGGSGVYHPGGCAAAGTAAAGARNPGAAAAAGATAAEEVGRASRAPLRVAREALGRRTSVTDCTPRPGHPARRGAAPAASGPLLAVQGARSLARHS